MSRYPDKLFIVRSSVVTIKTTESGDKHSHEEVNVERWLDEDAVMAYAKKMKKAGKNCSLHVRNFSTGRETPVAI